LKPAISDDRLRAVIGLAVVVVDYAEAAAVFEAHCLCVVLHRDRKLEAPCGSVSARLPSLAEELW
jgi:hypothetical protein